MASLLPRGVSLSSSEDESKTLPSSSSSFSSFSQEGKPASDLHSPSTDLSLTIQKLLATNASLEEQVRELEGDKKHFQNKLEEYIRYDREEQGTGEPQDDTRGSATAAKLEKEISELTAEKADLQVRLLERDRELGGLKQQQSLFSGREQRAAFLQRLNELESNARSSEEYHSRQLKAENSRLREELEMLRRQPPSHYHPHHHVQQQPGYEDWRGQGRPPSWEVIHPYRGLYSNATGEGYSSLPESLSSSSSSSSAFSSFSRAATMANPPLSSSQPITGTTATSTHPPHHLTNTQGLLQHSIPPAAPTTSTSTISHSTPHSTAELPNLSSLKLGKSSEPSPSPDPATSTATELKKVKRQLEKYKTANIELDQKLKDAKLELEKFAESRREPDVAYRMDVERLRSENAQLRARLDRANSENVDPEFSVFKIVEKMRQQRPAMVQAKDQYLFVYMAIAELARRSLGMNPTLPPKPAAKSLPVATGKGYLNVEISDPSSGSSHNSSPATPVTAPNPVYENVNNQPPLPVHRKSSTPEPPPIDTSSSSSSSSLKITIPPVVSQRPQAKRRATPPAQPHEEDKSVAGPAPKPRPRKPGGVATPTPPPNIPAPCPPSLSSSSLVAKPTPPPVANRSTTPNGSRPHPSSSAASMSPPKVAVRPKSPELSRRPLPSTPDGPSPPPSPVKEPSPTSFKPLPQPPPKAQPVEADATYSLVAQSEDTGPEIMVVDQRQQGRGGVPLRQLEEERRKKLPPVPSAAGAGAGGAKDSSNSRSNIMDTLMSALGEDVLNSIEKKDPVPTSRPLPSLPDESRDRGSSLDEPPPAIPQRTDARLELVDFTPVPTASVAAPTYDVPGEITSSSGGGGGVDTRKTTPSPSPAPMVTVNDMDYEEPSPPPMPIGAPALPTTPVPHTRPTAAKTLPPPSSATPTSLSSSSNKLGTKKLSGMFKKSKKSHDKKKPLEDSTVASTLPVTSRAVASRSSLGDLVVEEKYRFPGSLGFGIRLERPAGPREEPVHWKAVSLPNAIHVT